MIVLEQCMEILNLTSLAWKGRERYSVVAHSFRVMAKAKNFDEMVVGMMHELYAASAYTRSLYHCDVDGDPQWGMSLDLFTSPVKIPVLISGFMKEIHSCTDSEIIRENCSLVL